MDCRALAVDLDIDHWPSKIPFPGSCHLIAQLGSIPQSQPSIESQFCMIDSFCWPCVISWCVGRTFSHTDGRTLLFFLGNFNRMINSISYIKKCYQTVMPQAEFRIQLWIFISSESPSQEQSVLCGCNTPLSQSCVLFSTVWIINIFCVVYVYNMNMHSDSGGQCKRYCLNTLSINFGDRISY